MHFIQFFGSHLHAYFAFFRSFSVQALLITYILKRVQENQKTRV